MPNKPSSKESSPALLRALGQAAVKAGTDNNAQRMKEAGERALRLAQKAMREGQGGLVPDGVVSAIVEK